MKKIVARNVGIIVGLSVLFSAVVTGCGNTETPASKTSETTVTSTSTSVSEVSASVEEEVAPAPVLLKSFVSYYADGSLYESEEYDREGNLTKVGNSLISSVLDESGNTVVTRYIEDGLSSVTVTDPEGKLVKEVDPWGGETTYDYDDKGRLIEKFSTVEGLVKYSYDSKSRLTNEEYVGTGCYIDYKYDSDGTRTGKYYEGETVVYTETIKYDANGEIILCQRDELISSEDSWDGVGHFGSTKYSYVYAEDGKLLEMKEESLDEETHTYSVAALETHEYDEKGNETLKIEKYGDVEYQTRFENEYDEVGRLASVARYSDEVLSLSTYYSYYEEY